MEALIGVLNRGTALRAADLEPYFAAAYGINDGLDRTQTIADWVAEGPTAGGNTISGVSALSLEGVAGEDYHIYGSLTMSDGSSGFWDGGLIFTNEAGTWKLKGNGYKSGIYVLSDTHKWIRTDNTELVETGIMFEVYDRGNLNVNSAVITGPGLPVGGISLSKQAWDPVWLPIDAAYQNSTYRPGNVYVLGDQAISAIPENPEYTVTIYSTVDHTGAPVETRKSRLSKRPFRKSELTQAYFPQLSGVTSHALSAAKIGSTLTFSYGKPSAYPVTWMWSEFYFVGALGGQHASYGQDLLLTGSTAEYTTTAPSWTPSYAELTVQASDVFKRDISVHWMFGTSPVVAIQ